MDGIANVAKQQQTQINIEATPSVVTASHPSQQEAQVQASAKESQEENLAPQKIDSKKQVEDLVSELNDAMSPISTNLKFNVDKDDIFYVSVIEQDTNKMIRRFPAEKAASFLPKMQEVTGILFDSKG
jgi:flagellar protein FlaG